VRSAQKKAEVLADKGQFNCLGSTCAGHLTDYVMNDKPLPTEVSAILKQLYPGLSKEQIGEAEDNLRRYLALMIRIQHRLDMENESRAFDRKETVL
jgi:hypothetical protein